MSYTVLESEHRTGSDPVQVRGLRFRYGTGPTAVWALDGVDLCLAAGSFTAVMGPSGSGKSTLLHCLAGIEAATEGSVHIDGSDLTTLDESARARLRCERIGLIFQSFELVPYLSAEQNVVLPLRLAGSPIPPESAGRLLTAVGIADRSTHHPAQLSGGQQQRVAIARALVADPAVILADEPTGALDSAMAAQVLGLLRQAVDRDGRTVLMVTHDPSAAAVADRVVFLFDGRVAGELVNPDAPTVADRMARLTDAAARAAS